MSSAPLAGRSVVVCRAEAQADGLIRRLELTGADVVRLPLIEVVEPSDRGSALDAAAGGLDRFDWLVFTSANAVAALIDRAPAAQWPDSLGVVAVGPATSSTVDRAGGHVAVVPANATAAALADAMPDARGQRVLLPVAQLADSSLQEALERKGYVVERVEAYRTTIPDTDPALLAAAREADAVVLTSPSIVDRYLGTVGVAPSVVVCIGPRTAERARLRGLPVTAVAEPHTDEGLITAVLNTLTS